MAQSLELGNPVRLTPAGVRFASKWVPRFYPSWPEIPLKQYRSLIGVVSECERGSIRVRWVHPTMPTNLWYGLNHLDLVEVEPQK